MMRKSPTNYIILVVFTVAEACLAHLVLTSNFASLSLGPQICKIYTAFRSMGLCGEFYEEGLFSKRTEGLERLGLGPAVRLD